MKQILLVFLGGGAGSALRFLISRAINTPGILPYGTFLVNILGSLLIGFLFSIGVNQKLLSGNAMLLLATGFCGGFTTFSAFAYENHLFLKNGDLSHFLLYSLGSILLGVSAVLLGFYFGKNLG